MVIEIIIESSFAELLSKPHVGLQQFLPSKRKRAQMSNATDGLSKIYTMKTSSL
jgi:hypothetical protein